MQDNEQRNKKENSSNNKNYLVISEILLLFAAIYVVSIIFYPINNITTIFSLVVWGLFTIFGYLFGEFEPSVSIYFGLSIRTQVIFIFSLISYVIIYILIPTFHLINIRFWILLWLYLNFLAPLIGMALRYFFPFPIIYVSDQNNQINRLRWWGYKITEQVKRDDFDNWLRNHSDDSGCIPHHYLILLDISNCIKQEKIDYWVKNYFITFIGIKSFCMINYLTGAHTQIMSRYPGRGTAYRLKRAIDFFICISTLILTAPLLLFIFLCIKVDSPGSVFYRHRRLGKNMKPFDLLKLRTMYQNADKKLKAILNSDKKLKEEFEKTFKLKNDPRITRTGKIIRQLSLDELPQIFNVLKGDMSLVGPRPIVQAEIPYYQKYSLDLFRVLPGMTGLWQISGRTETSYDERIKLDTQYVRTWSLFNDIKMLIKTIPAIISQKGAY